MKKISRRILTLLMAVIMVAATFVPAFAETAEVDDGHDHEQTACAHEHHEQDGEAVESTCTAFGYTRYHCLDCGEYYLSDFMSMRLWLSKRQTASRSRSPKSSAKTAAR